MYSTQKLMTQIDNILHNQLFGVIATEGTKYPYCTLVGFVALKDCREIIFATLRDTRKYQNISRESNVSLLIDNRSNSTKDLKDAMALTILGKATEIRGDSYTSYCSSYLKKHPNLKEFISAPNCTLIKVEVTRYVLVSNFQNVTEVEIP